MLVLVIFTLAAMPAYLPASIAHLSATPLAVNLAGLATIAYYEATDGKLKVATQRFPTFLPLIARHDLGARRNVADMRARKEPESFVAEAFLPSRFELTG